MTHPETAPRRGGPPRAGVIIAATAAIVALLVFAVTRQPPPGAAGGEASAPAALPPEVAANAPSSHPPANTPAAAPAANRPATAAAPSVRPGPRPSEPEEPTRRVDSNELPPDHPTIASDESTQVGIQWLGRSCFYIHSPGGATVVIDPFDPKVTGLAAPQIRAHLVAASSDDPAHGFTRAVQPFAGERKEVVRGQAARRGDLTVTPVPTSGGNTAHVIQAGALRIAHLGRLTAPLTDREANALGTVDILLVPVGEGLSPKDAVAVTKRLAPRIVIPMAYSALGMEGPAAKLRRVDDFVAASPFARTDKDMNVILISRPELPESTEIYTLRYQPD